VRSYALFGLALAACSASRGVPSAAPEPTAAPASSGAVTATPVANAQAQAPTPSAKARERAREVGALDASLKDKLHALRADPPPRAITRQRHYFTSNENQHYLLRDVLADLGGIHMGVGAEQNYLYAGWARSEVVICLDFDQWIAELHWVYGILFEHASSPEELIALWAYREQKRVRGWIQERWPEQKDHWRKLRAFGEARADVEQRLMRLAARHQRLKVASFLTDQGQFDWVRELWRTGRVMPVRGDLTQGTAVKDVAAFARAAGLSLRSLYLSNAEDYFSYDAGHFRDNMLALPFDQRSVIVRTKPYDGHYYEYIYQPGLKFHAWLKSGRVATMCELARFSRRAQGASQHKDLYTLLAPPSQKEPERRHRCE
jgi:hypothetical protein